MTTVNEWLKARRLALEMDIVRAARAANLSVHEYEDIEMHPDEFATAIDIATAKRVCAALGVDLIEVLKLPPINLEAREGIDHSSGLRALRMKSGLSIHALAEKVGFDSQTIESIEANRSNLEAMPIFFLIHYSAALGVNPASLL